MSSLYDDGMPDLNALFNNAGQVSGLDPDWLSAVSMAESSHNPAARSPVGAEGLMQLMPNTAADPGLGTGVRPFDTNKSLSDPEENVRFGADYLAYLVKRYDGDTKLALMAYNGGMGTVDKWLKDGADPAKMNKETREYPGRVQAALDKIKSSNGPASTDELETALNVAAPAPSKGESQVAELNARVKNLKRQANIPTEKSGWLKGRAERAGAAGLSAVGGVGQMIDDFDNFVGDWIPMQDSLDSLLSKAREMHGSADTSMPEDGSWARWGTDLVDSTIQMLPAVAATIATKNPNLGLSIMGGQVAGDSYQQAREEGLDPAEAAFRAGRAAAWELGPEKALGFFKHLPIASGVKGWLTQGAREAVGEGITSGLNIGDEVLMQGHEFEGAGETLKRIGYEASLGAGMGLALGAGALGKKEADGTPVDDPIADVLPEDVSRETPPDDVPPATGPEALNLDRFEEPGAAQPYNPNPEQLDLWGGPPTEDLPLMPPPRGTLGGVSTASRPGSRQDPDQLVFDMPVPPNLAIASGRQAMEAALDHTPNLPNAADALAEPNEEQKKGMFERAQEKLAKEQALGDNNAANIAPEDLENEVVYGGDLTIGDETLASLPNVSSQDAAELDARLKSTVPNDEVRGMAVEGLLEQLNEARAETPESTIESVLGNVLPKQAAPAPTPTTEQPPQATAPEPEPEAPAPEPELTPEQIDAAWEAEPEALDPEAEADQQWAEQVELDPEGSFQELVEQHGYTEEEAAAEIDGIMANSNLVPANETEAEYDREKLQKGRMRPVTQPATGQGELRVTRTQPAVNDFEARLAERAKTADPGQEPGDQIAGEEVLAGDVLDLWHGTTVDFDLHQAKTDGLSPGLWFSNNEKTADHYMGNEWAGQQDAAGPKRPRKMVVRAVPKNPLTIPWTEEFNNMHQYHQAVNLAKEMGHDMVVFTGIDPAFAGVKGGAGSVGKADSQKPTQGVKGIDNYYVVLDKNILTHRPGQGTLMLTPEESAKMEMDQAAAARAKIHPADLKDYDQRIRAEQAAAELEEFGKRPVQKQLFRNDGKPTRLADQREGTPAPVKEGMFEKAKKKTAAKKTASKKATTKKATTKKTAAKKPTVAPDTKVADTSQRVAPEQKKTHSKFKMQQLVKVRKQQLKVLSNILPEGSTFAASVTPDGLIFNTKEQAEAFYAMMKDNFQGKKAKMKGQVPPNIMKSMMNVAMKVNKASKSETVPNPNAPVVETKATTKKVTKKRGGKKKVTKKVTQKSPAPTTIEAPPATDPVPETTASPEEAVEEVTAESREPEQVPGKPEEIKDEEKPAAEAASATKLGMPPTEQTVVDNSPESTDDASNAQTEEINANLDEKNPDDAAESSDAPGNRTESEEDTKRALEDTIYMHSGKWADLFYYWVANTEFMGLKKSAAKYHSRQTREQSTARGDVLERKKYLAKVKAWNKRKAKAKKEFEDLIKAVNAGATAPAGYDPDAGFTFAEPKPEPFSRERPDGQPAEFNADEFKELYKRAYGRTKVWWMERMVDQHYAVKLIHKVMADKNGYVKDAIGLYEALTRVGSAVDVKIKKFRGSQQKAIEDAAEAAGMSFQEVNDYSAALHSIMRNGYIFRRTLQENKTPQAMQDDVPGYSGMSNNAAYATLEAMEAKFSKSELAVLEDAVFDAAQYLRGTLTEGGLSSEAQQNSWSPGPENEGIHKRYKELRDGDGGHAAALDPANYKKDAALWASIPEKEVIDRDPNSPYTWPSPELAKEATLLDTLHNITYVPLSDIRTETVAEVVRQQIQAKAGANFYSEYDVWGEDVGKAYGRTSPAGQAVTHLLSASQQAVIRAEHNEEHAKRIRDMVTEAKTPALGVVLPQKKEGYYNTPGNIKKEIIYAFAAMNEPVPNLETADIDRLTFRYKEGDMTTPTVIFDVVTANALTNSYTGTNTKRVFNAIGNSSMYVRKAMTAWSPPFIGTNFVREVFNAKIQARGIEGLNDAQLKAVQEKASFAESFKWMKTIYRQVKDPNYVIPDDATQEERAMAEQFKEMHEAGMTSEFFHIKDLAQLESEMKKIEKNLGSPTKSGMKNAAGSFKKLGELLENAAAVSENAVRMAVAAEATNQKHKELLAKEDKEGNLEYTPEAARAEAVNFGASIGKDLSVNFQRYGTWGSAVNSLFFFYNPTVQGLYRAKRALHHKDVQKIVAGAAVFGAMMPLLNRMLAGEDEEGKNYYESVPHWKRSTNFIMMVPGGEGRHITIPLPYVWNLPYAMSEKLVDALSSDSQEAAGAKAKRIAGEMFGLAMENVSPVSYSSADPIRTVVPTMAQPYYDVMNNQNWFGSYINPGKNHYSAAPVSDAWNVKDPDSKKKWQFLSQAMAIGGSKYEKGLIDVSPGSLEYLFGYYTGGAGTFMTRIFDTTAAVVTGGGGKSFEENVAAAPLLRRVYGLGDMKAGIADRYYTLRTDLQAVKNAHKDLTTDRDREGIQALMANEGDLYKTGTMRRFEQAEKQVRKLVTARNRIIKRKNKTEQQLKQIELYNKRITDIQRKFNQYYFDRIVSENM